MYTDRQDAGRVLARELAGMALVRPLVLAVPRGGVLVAAPVAKKLSQQVHLLVTRKIGHPANPEVAIGAVMPDGAAMLDEKSMAQFSADRDWLEAAVAAEQREIVRRMRDYTGASEPPQVVGRDVILIDDGIATGNTIRAAITWLKKKSPAKIVIAVPVAPAETVEELAALVDEVICPLKPRMFMAVGMYYNDFSQTTDDEVRAILHKRVH